MEGAEEIPTVKGQEKPEMVVPDTEQLNVLPVLGRLTVMDWLCTSGGAMHPMKIIRKLRSIFLSRRLSYLE
jgi:hypothetical protein